MQHTYILPEGFMSELPVNMHACWHACNVHVFNSWNCW